jgi:hypothetical protein
MMTRARLVGVALAMVGVAAGVAGGTASCSQSPTNVAVRTFELAQKVDVVCMQVNDVNGVPLGDGPKPAPQDQCAPVAANTSGAPLPFHLFALVTQLARGELAVVDLTAGNVVDEDRTTPGINFIPVGPTPTDVVVAPDAQMSFVSSGDANKPAIYGVPNKRILGDQQGSPPPPPLQLPDLVACALPQVPDALTVAPVGPDGQYVLVAMMRKDPGAPAAIAAIDPHPLVAGEGLDAGTGFDGGAGPVAPGSLTPCTVLGATALSPSVPSSWTAGPAWPDGVPYVDGGVDLSDAEPSLGAACAASAAGGGTLGDGGAGAGSGGPIPVAVAPSAQPHPVAMVMRNDPPLLYVADDALPLIHVIDLSDPTAPREAAPLLATSILEPTRRVTAGALALSPPTRDYHRYLYAVDASVRTTVMVYDVTDPASPARAPLQRPHAELNPFLPPDRIVFSAPVATLAFVEHDWPLPSQVEGSSPVHQYSGLLCNPNQNAHPNPNTFADLGAYFRADPALTALIQTSGTVLNFPDRLRGIFAFVTLSNGAVAIVDVDDWDAPCRRPDPMSADPQVTDHMGMAYPGPMSGVLGVLDVPQQPPAGKTDFDPYHTPLAYNGAIPEIAATTLEVFFPVSAPNRLRSNFLLRNDPQSGFHVPNLISPALLFDLNGAPLPISGPSGIANPIMLPTPLSPGFVDPSRIQNPTEPNPASRTALVPGLANSVSQATPPSSVLPGPNNPSGADLRISFDDPTADVDQDWTVTYEGALPTVNGVNVDIASFDDYRTLTFASSFALPDAGAVGGVDSSPAATASAGFCARGIEDWDLGQERAGAMLAGLGDVNAQLQAQGQPTLPQPGACGAGGFTLPQWTADYVEIADDLLASTDPYWTVPSSPTQDCWDPPLADPDGFTGSSPHAQERYNACYGQFNTISNGDTFYARDFPILQAYDDHLVVGRYGWLDRNGSQNILEQPNNRVVVGPDDSNRAFLRLARCCFHHQATFKVRTGGEWVIVGSVSGLLHRVRTDPATGRCVQSCNPVDALKNARTIDVPWGKVSTVVNGACAPVSPPDCTPPASLPSSLNRNSPLAVRNPMFSFVLWSGCTPLVGNDHTETARDMQWRFSLRGGFVPLTLTIAQGTNAVAPQSMRFIDSLGQLAIVDGSLQGLVLFDLNSLAFAHAPYF